MPVRCGSGRLGLAIDLQVSEIQKRTIGDNKLSEFLETIVARTPPPDDRGKPVQFFKITQAATSPARIRIYLRGNIPDNYLRFIERNLRGEFDFEGVPIRIALVHR